MLSNFFHNYSLKKHNTFNIDESAEFFFEFYDTDEFVKFAIKNEIKSQFNKVLTLGCGSNILFTKKFEGIIIHPKNIGIEILENENEQVLVKVQAGTVWDDFVEWAVENNLSGLENLSLIPGTVGASPVQNIGAYGVEAKDRIMYIEGFLFENNKKMVLLNSECEFAYRQSIFKNSLKNKFLITSVIFRLSKSQNYSLDYGDIKNELKNFKGINLSNIRQSIINIRERKLPDTTEFPNAGSFFKNPIASLKKINEIKTTFSNIPIYPFSENDRKLSAGWLIEKCGWKGKQIENVGVHKNQALVIVNHGNATGNEILNFSEQIKKSVLDKFGINIETEVNIH
ncbi:MAG: UDP-N-acetylmuramate dehydrogenase [Bacteroidetes bacterium]|jgi:UDP-N-acetylmuramate dehydrogenase|nr:UDP-N-acetylmuramate dehydrogenase [Bacteroidota bacterium]MBT6686688.1 UDP-N-acetylmuramate dehydrogenase [Bacteroidota bacterium]MBT7141826.1 UDP-N-acetylmuramate dehydrogenase [Bacteroidota bacterium]MBT7490683.1 UDP-N-acetylmuramate dehydrogenase [Bacteroidota bacterium]